MSSAQEQLEIMLTALGDMEKAYATSVEDELESELEQFDAAVENFLPFAVDFIGKTLILISRAKTEWSEVAGDEQYVGFGVLLGDLEQISEATM